MNPSLPSKVSRRKFVQGTVMAAAGLLCGTKGWALTLGTAGPEAAVQFVQDFGDRFVVRESVPGTVRLITEVTDPVRLGKILQQAGRYGVGPVLVSGNQISFLAGDCHYDVECLDAEAFRGRTAGSFPTGMAG